MGIADFQMGIEHGNYEFRKKYLKRNYTNAQVIESCHLLDKYKIPFTVNNLIGFAHETRELIFDTINLNKKIDLPYLKSMNVFFVNPYKGTELYSQYIEEGLMDSEAKSMQLLAGKEFKYFYMTREEVLGLQRTFPLYVKMSKYENRINFLYIFIISRF
jgi:radical SAM superfamily enzyme YgiQ (UPF0313 family)